MIYETQPRSMSFTDLCPRSLRFNIFKLLFKKKKKKKKGHLKLNFIKACMGCEAKFHKKPAWDVGMKIHSNILGHMTKMASRPIYGKNLKKSPSFGTESPMTLKLGIQQRVLKNYQICSNDDTGLTMTIFMTCSNLFPYASVWVKAYIAYSQVK